MAVRPRAVVRSALGQGRPLLLRGGGLGEHLGGDDAPAQALGLDGGLGAGDIGGAVLACARRPRIGHGPQQLLQLVDQGHVRHRPRPAARAREGPQFVGAQGRPRAPVRLGEHLGPGVQAPEQGRRGRRHPRQVDRPARIDGVADLGQPRALLVLADATLPVRAARLLGEAHREHVHELAREALARHVVGAAGALRVAPGAIDVGAAQNDPAVPHAQLLVALRQPRQAPDRLPQDPRPGGQALEAREGGVLHRRGAHARHQRPHGPGHDPRLAQGGENGLDVAQEYAGRAHQEHAGALQPLALGVEQVGDAVQGDGRLARAGPSLDHHQAPVGRADDLVLLGLDGRHDVAHPALARRVERAHQGALARELQVLAVGVGGVQQLVLQRRHRALARRDVAAAHHTARLHGRRLVEGLRRGGPPVDEQGRSVVGGHGDPPHVADRAVFHVEAPEDEALLHALQARRHAAQVLGQGLALRPRLRVARAVGGVGPRLALAVRGAQGVEAPVRAVHEVLLGQGGAHARRVGGLRVQGVLLPVDPGPPIVSHFPPIRCRLRDPGARLRHQLKTGHRVTRAPPYG